MGSREIAWKRIICTIRWISKKRRMDRRKKNKKCTELIHIILSNVYSQMFYLLNQYLPSPSNLRMYS
jgi:hypothetical protein